MQPPNTTLSREGLSKEGSNSRQVTAWFLPRQASNPLPGDSMASQEASAALNAPSTPSREGLSQEGNNSQTGNNLVSTQAGRQTVRHSTRLRASQAAQADSGTPQLDSKVSLASQALPQVVRCSIRLKTSRGNSATPQMSRASSQEGNTSPPNSRANIPQGSSMEEPNPKWVINLSSKPLTQVQRSVLAKGPNLAVTPRHPPNLEFITAIETALLN